MKLNPSNLPKVPQSMRDAAQWVLWRLESRGGRPTKVPVQIDGKPASSNDRATWSAFDKIAAAFDPQKHEGIGFVFSADDTFCGVDLDHCRDPDSGDIDDWAREVIEKLDSYSEVSPSQTGVKVFVRGDSPYGTGKNIRLPYPAKDGGDDPTGIEVYDHGRYFAVTGLRLRVSDAVNDRQDQLNWIADKFQPPARVLPSPQWESPQQVIERARKYISTIEPAISGSGGHNQTFKVACVLILGFGLKDSEALSLLEEWNQRCQPPWSEKELLHKIEDASRQNGARNYLRNAREDEWQRIELPPYAPKLAPRPEGTIRQMRDLMIAATKHDDDRAKLLSLGLPELDKAIGGGAALGEFVLFAARPSHGKSALGLQACHQATAHGINCAFFSEEMSLQAVAQRGMLYADTQSEEEVIEYFEKRAKWFVSEPCVDVDRLVQQVNDLAETEDVKMVVVDYAQLLSSRGSRYEQVTDVSQKLHNAAIRNNIVLIALCQMSRGIESRSAFTPMMSDLRESGQLEQDADVIVFLVWPWKVDSRHKPDKYQLFLAKNRNREIAASVVDCEFDPRRQMVKGQSIENHPNYQAAFNEFNQGGVLDDIRRGDYEFGD